jgi:hypothetical protein
MASITSVSTPPARGNDEMLEILLTRIQQLEKRVRMVEVSASAVPNVPSLTPPTAYPATLAPSDSLSQIAEPPNGISLLSIQKLSELLSGHMESMKGEMISACSEVYNLPLNVMDALSDKAPDLHL